MTHGTDHCGEDNKLRLRKEKETKRYITQICSPENDFTK
jgi:hypothetical protein